MLKQVLIFLCTLAMLLIISSCATTSYTYVKVKETLSAGKTDNLTDEELEIESLLKKASEIPLCASYFKQFFSTAFLILDGFDELCFTVTIKDENTTVTRGIDPAANPDLVIHLNKQNCENLFGILQDGEISDEEEYRIFYVTFLPSYKSILKKDQLYDPAVAKGLALPDFMQIILKNENNYVYQNTTKELTMTVVNVDGQWLVFKGLMGDPDVRYAVTHKQAKEFTTMVLKASTANNEDRLALLNNIKAFMEKTTVYKRK